MTGERRSLPLPPAAKWPVHVTGGSSPRRPLRVRSLLGSAALLPCLVTSALAVDVEPSFGDQLLRVLSLRDYNTRVVVLGVTLLGAAAGAIGAFLLLRKRALLSDAVSHATLPGIAAAFLLMTALGGDGKALPGLLIGAAITGTLGMVLVIGIGKISRLKEDAAMGIVLSVFFGAGVALLGLIQKMSSGSQAGLESFVYGKTASMVASDAVVIGGAAVVVALTCAALYKEFRLLCFDAQFAASQGWPVFALDAVLMALAVGVTVIGLQAVGLILVIALLIIPAAAARFWTEQLAPMIWISVLLGAASGALGAVVSALAPKMPAGAIIVVVAASLFAVSLVLGPSRGIAVRLAARWRSARRVGRQHLLRALYEWLEDRGRLASAQSADLARGPGMSVEDILATRSWSRRGLARLLRSASRRGLVRRAADSTWLLTERGLADARRTVRNHRLWELYLITHADIAPSHVDRDADEIEHVLGTELVGRLEAMVRERHPAPTVPPSPHAIDVGATK